MRQGNPLRGIIWLHRQLGGNMNIEDIRMDIDKLLAAFEAAIKADDKKRIAEIKKAIRELVMYG